MRTTVELKPEHRAALLELVARRGDKDLSAVIEEAVEAYLGQENDRERRRQELRALAGSLPSDEAQSLRDSTRQIRESWR